jgi:hypothetical protein
MIAGACYSVRFFIIRAFAKLTHNYQRLYGLKYGLNDTQNFVLEVSVHKPF